MMFSEKLDRDEQDILRATSRDLRSYGLSIGSRWKIHDNATGVFVGLVLPRSDTPFALFYIEEIRELAQYTLASAKDITTRGRK